MIFRKKKKQELFGEAKKFHDIATKINEDNEFRRAKEFNEKIKDEIDGIISEIAKYGQYKLVLDGKYYRYKDLICKEYSERGFKIDRYYFCDMELNILISWE